MIPLAATAARSTHWRSGGRGADMGGGGLLRLTGNPFSAGRLNDPCTPHADAHDHRHAGSV